jgi:hypothetical protein
MRVAFLAILIAFASLSPTQAQEAAPADSVTLARPDTSATILARAPGMPSPLAVSDSARSAWPEIFKIPIAARIPARTLSFELTDMLRDEPTSMLYDLGSYGWPHGWSPAGLSPQHVGLVWSGIPLRDLFTGRPLYDLLPLASAGTPDMEFAPDDGSPVGLHVNTLVDYEKTADPLTELRYQSGSGLQKVSGLHTQNRRLAVGGRDGVLNLLFSYGGESADGEYPGSRLSQGRQIYSRVKYLRPGWSLELGDLYNKRSVGAHGGVVPRITNDLESIYQRLGATVIDPEARRATKRNDVFATFRRDRGGAGRNVTSATAGYSSQQFEYRREADTLTVRSTALFFQISHALARTRHRLTFDVNGTSNTTRPRSDALVFASETDSRLLATVAEEVRFGALHALAKLGLETRSDGTQLLAKAAVWQSFGPAVFRLDASQTAQPVSQIDRTGLGPFLAPIEKVPIGPNRLVRASLSVAAGPLDLTVLGTLTGNATWTDYLATEDPDSVRAAVGTGTLRVVSAGLDFGYRRQAQRGFYFTAQPTVFGVSKTEDALQELYRSTVPDFYAVASLGVRYLIFQRDLDLDISIRGRFWSEFAGRALHPQSGLLVIPVEGARPVESSATLDLIVTGGVRTATLFLAYENFLSGTSFLPGNLLVPVYPLAEKRIRFGVFWPIQN